MKNLLYIFCLSMISVTIQSQSQKFPVFKGCENSTILEMENCFNEAVKNAVLEEFVSPKIVVSDQFKGTVNVLFFVTRKGTFNVVHVNSPYKEITSEVKRIFGMLPKVVPAQYNGHAIDMSFAMPLNFPNPKLSYGVSDVKVEEFLSKKVISKKNKKKKILKKYSKSKFLKHQSNLNIPFHHERYTYLEKQLIKENNVHTSVKPYLYKNVSEYIDLDAQKSRFLKKKKSWIGRKFWNENLVTVKGDDYWFTTNMLLNVELGKDNSDIKYTFNNSRILQMQGELGAKFSFSATIYESQGRFAEYVNKAVFAEQWKTFDSGGLVFGRGKAKGFKENAYDYPVSEGYLSYSPNRFFDFQMGQGKNFIGDGYRSLLLSDTASPYPYFKMTTSFWKFQYTNLWMWMTDIRREAKVGESHPRKYVSSHYLSININKRLNVGLYEAVITDNSRTGGLDMDFVNPLIFYKSLEFARGEDSGSSVVGINARYKFSDKFSMYSQFVLDEFTLEELKAQTGYWANKYGFQLGMKYFEAFKVEGLSLQGEFNWLRPYTFSHKTLIYNYGHYGESLAHPWGANFWETIGIARYKNERWSANWKVVLGQKGFDDGDVNYGGDIYKSYDTRIKDYGNEVGQGAKATILNSDLQVAYLINPTTDLKVFAGIVYRQFTPEEATTTFTDEKTTWFTFGLKVNLFNWYLDF